MKKLGFALLLCLLSSFAAHAQTALNVTVTWSDGAHASSAVSIVQLTKDPTDGSTISTEIWKQTSNDGHITGSVVLDPAGVYVLSVFSNQYAVQILNVPFSTGFATGLPVKSATLNLFFTRPAGSEPAAIATRTKVSFTL